MKKDNQTSPGSQNRQDFRQFAHFKVLEVPGILFSLAWLAYYFSHPIISAFLTAFALFYICVKSIPSLLNSFCLYLIKNCHYLAAEKCSMLGLKWCKLLKLEGSGSLPRSFSWDCLFISSLTQAYLQQSRFEESLNKSKELLDLLEQAHDLDGAAKVRGQMAFCLIAMGRLSEAESILDRAIPFLESGMRGAEREGDIKARVYRARLCSALFEKATLYETKRDFVKAEKIRRKALNEAKILSENDDESAIMTHLCMLAKCLSHLNKFEEAEAMATRVFEYRSKTMHPDHILLASASQGLGRVLCAMDKLDLAEPYLQKALDSAVKAVGDKHPDIPTFKCDLAKLRIKQNKFKDADDLLISAIEHTERIQGKNHPNLIEYLLALEDLKTKEGNESQAHSYKERARQILKSID